MSRPRRSTAFARVGGSGLRATAVCTLSALSAVLLGGLAGGCATGGGGAQWAKPCATQEDLATARQACIGEASGLSDDDYGAGIGRTAEAFAQCMEARGWSKLGPGQTLACPDDER